VLGIGPPLHALVLRPDADGGGGLSKISAQHFGCSTARNKGPSICTNIRTLRRDVLEDTILQVLRSG